MKKLLCVLIAICLLAGLCACGQPRGEQPEQKAITPITPPEKVVKQVRLVAVGDNLIHDTIIKAGETDHGYDFRPMYEYIRPLLQGAQIKMINQESPMGGESFGHKGYPNFNTPQQMGKDLLDVGFNVITHANNHAMDCGDKAVQGTVKFWQEEIAAGADIVVSGIYDSQEDRDMVRIMEVEGIKFAFVSYTYGTNGIPVKVPYRVSLIDKELIRADVEKARQQADVVIAVMHWGQEYQIKENAEQDQLAQFLADLQVDLVIGHHPHVIQPVEWLQGESGNQTLITYSLGNFISSQKQKQTMLGAMAEVVFESVDGEVSIKSANMIPLVTHTSKNLSVSRVYPLAEYTDQLAAQHRVDGLSVGYFDDLATQVFGEFYNK